MKVRNTRLLAVLLAVLVFAGGGPAQANEAQARAKGIAWLLLNQNGDGSWGRDGGKVAATSEVLAALRHAGAGHGFLYARALSWLGNKKTDSVDSLARKIMALENAGIDAVELGLTDELLKRRNALKVWGAFGGYDGGFPDASLAMSAILSAGIDYPAADINAYFNAVRTGQKDGDSGWSSMAFKPGAERPPRIMPTAYNLITLSAYHGNGRDLSPRITPAVNWLLNTTRQADGSFLDKTGVTAGVVHKTALAYRAIDAAKNAGIAPAGSAEALAAAKALLLSQQGSDGSWQGDPYQSALALQTLPKVSLPDRDGDGIPDAVEPLVNTNPNRADGRALLAANGFDPDGLYQTPLEADPINLEILLDRVFTYSVTVTGGQAGYTWAVANGRLPQGLSIQPGSGTLTGTPTGTGIYSFILAVTDSNGAFLTVPGLIRVIGPNDTLVDSDGDSTHDGAEVQAGRQPLINEPVVLIPMIDRLLEPRPPVAVQ